MKLALFPVPSFPDQKHTKTILKGDKQLDIYNVHAHELCSVMAPQQVQEKVTMRGLHAEFFFHFSLNQR